MPGYGSPKLMVALCHHRVPGLGYPPRRGGDCFKHRAVSFFVGLERLKTMEHLDLTTRWVGLAELACFVIAYTAVVAEERLHVRKSVPVLLAALVIWIFVGVGFVGHGAAAEVADLARHTLLEFAELLLFLIPAMTFVNTLQDRHVFDVLRVWLIRRGLSLRALFWVTGGLAFVLSPIADNLTTALLLGAVVMAVGRGHPKFITLACINIVVAANAGGAFSPFGDITTLMVWQAGKVPFGGFFALLLPSLVNWLVPAVSLSLAIRGGHPAAVDQRPRLQPGAGCRGGALPDHNRHDRDAAQFVGAAAGRRHDGWARIAQGVQLSRKCPPSVVGTERRKRVR